MGEILPAFFVRIFLHMKKVQGQVKNEWRLFGGVVVR